MDNDVEQQPAFLDSLIAAMKQVFGADQKRISHALAVLEHAQEILNSENADRTVVLAAAILHDIGIQEAERKHGSNAGVYQEMEGPPIARNILQDLGLDPDAIESVVTIVGSHHTVRGVDTPEFRIIWDADWLVNMPDNHPDLRGSELVRKIERIFRTEAGKKRAYELYGEGARHPERNIP